MDSKVDFVAVDFPQANRLTVHILAAVAEHEGKMISDRTKSALTAAKARGIKLGNPRNITPEAQAKGAKLGNESRQKKADAFASEWAPVIKKHREDGLNLSQIAASFNNDGILTATGKAGAWTAQAIKNVLSHYDIKVTV